MSKIKNYNPTVIELKWQSVWEKEEIYRPDLDKAKRPFYNLMMFPYPSAEGMHVGNMYAFTGADVYGRFKRMQGHDIFEPIGLDGFGIHSENYAIKVGNHPVEQAKISEKNFYRQLKSIGNGFDWARTVETYKPEYYKWTQWLFIQLFKAGLAYRKKAPVNFCPSCKTVLADEQVVAKKEVGKTGHGSGYDFMEPKGEERVCERCGTEIEKRDLEQWFFRITKYADRLLANIPKLDWSEKVKIAQEQWIGRSEGTLIRFKIKDLPAGKAGLGFKNQVIEVFTTRADTLYGATFIVLAPEHPVSEAIKDSKIRAYIEKAKKIQKSLERDKEKTGVFTGLYAVNPLNNEEIPVWIADYAVMGYGTGALFGDAHDERDAAFAKKYNIPLKPTVKTGDSQKDKRIKNLEECFTGYGTLFDSGEFSGLTSKEAMIKVTSWLEKKGVGGKEKTYHIRDWLISRQRYWGPPIPMIFCADCSEKGITGKTGTTSTTGDSPRDTRDTLNTRGTLDMAGWFPDENLPVLLPFIEDYKPLGTGQAPLASHPEFYKTKCPNCGKDAKRETDVSDTFLDSAWYFLRYIATEFDDVPFDKTRAKKWLPVNMYIGGAEHSVLHLLYSRFITMALKDLGFINFEEPFAKFRAHGLIVKDGAKMSKSRGNVVIPDEYIRKFGADTLRTYLMFTGPYSQGGDFRDSGIEGMYRFLKRVWRLVSEHSENSASQKVRKSDMSDDLNRRRTESSEFSERMMHKTIKKVTEDIEGLNYNTAIAALMEWYNYLSGKLKVKSEKLTKEEMETFVKLISPFAPHVSEELFSMINADKNQRMPADNNWQSVHLSAWPSYDPKFLVKDEFVIVVQINGKLRGNLMVDLETSKNKAKIEELARKDSKVVNHLEGKNVKKVIYVEGKVVNFAI